MSGVRQQVVARDEDGMRLDRWFATHFPQVTFGHLQKLLRSGQIRVDSGRVKANARLATRLSAAQELQAHLSKLADEMKSLGGAASKQRTTLPPGASLLNVVTTSAHAAGVQQHTKKMAPVGANALSLYLDDMPFNELAQWLVNLDQQQGIEVERATIEALPVIGTVRADLTLKARL